MNWSPYLCGKGRRERVEKGWKSHRQVCQIGIDLNGLWYFCDYKQIKALREPRRFGNRLTWLEIHSGGGRSRVSARIHRGAGEEDRKRNMFLPKLMVVVDEGLCSWRKHLVQALRHGGKQLISYISLVNVEVRHLLAIEKS